MKPELVGLAADVLAACRTHGLKLATAESCTGGLIAAYLTEVAGSSDVFDRGLVTYSNQAKIDMLGVGQALLETHGAVSVETARAMALGAWERTGGGAAVAVTGVAGPSGGSAEKPVGLVYIGVAVGPQIMPALGPGLSVLRYEFGDIGRSAVREETVKAALTLLLAVIAGRATLED